MPVLINGVDIGKIVAKVDALEDALANALREVSRLRARGEELEKRVVALEKKTG